MPQSSTGSGRAAGSGSSALSPQGALLLAAWFGLMAGYVELAGILLKRDVLHASVYYKQGWFFPWAVPLADLVILMIPGALVAGLNRLRPGTVSVRLAAWLLATLGLWGALLNLPLKGAASLVLALGLGRWIGGAAAAPCPRRRRWGRRSLVGLVGALGIIAAASIGRHVLAESRAFARLPAPRPGSPNVLLIVLDTVRARSLSLYGYARLTTPQLTRWARRGVRFDRAVAPACWTFPTHCSLFTGRWPFELDAHWQLVLNTAHPTIAEFLAARGYLTAGFVANTSYCSAESGLGRGFARYDDYRLSPRTILGTTALGRWIVGNVLSDRDFYGRKWDLYQSRDARGINRAFLDWLDRRGGRDRPFFAFLNYLDAHEPYLVPGEHKARFGAAPGSRRDYEMLLNYWDRDKTHISPHDVALARDGYDDCIAFLDGQVGALLDELDRRGALEKTVVIITSDHGEEFGERGVFDHGYSLYLDAVHVPLVILAPTAPAGRIVAEPVSLRDVPATVVDLLGLAADSPFPGRSLASRWRTPPGAAPPRTSPAISEGDFLTIGLDPRRGPGPSQRGYTMSQVASGWHYFRDSTGAEGLYDLTADPAESRNLEAAAASRAAIVAFRHSILRLITEAAAALGQEPQYLRRYRVLLRALTPAAPPSEAKAGQPEPPTDEPERGHSSITLTAGQSGERLRCRPAR
jgi:arylsulfatase A-like enzyme